MLSILRQKLRLRLQLFLPFLSILLAFFLIFRRNFFSYGTVALPIQFTSEIWITKTFPAKGVFINIVHYNVNGTKLHFKA